MIFVGFVIFVSCVLSVLEQIPSQILEPGIDRYRGDHVARTKFTRQLQRTNQVEAG